MQYHFDDFKGCLDQSFALELEGSIYPLTLISADKLNSSATVDGREAFSIVFRGERSLKLEQKIYRISHNTMGDMELFIVPIGPDDKGMRYEAVFS